MFTDELAGPACQIYPGTSSASNVHHDNHLEELYLRPKQRLSRTAMAMVSGIFEVSLTNWTTSRASGSMQFG